MPPAGSVTARFTCHKAGVFESQFADGRQSAGRTKAEGQLDQFWTATRKCLADPEGYSAATSASDAREAHLLAHQRARSS